MCVFLNIARGTYYYQAKDIKHDTELENKIIQRFKDSRNDFLKAFKKLLLKLLVLSTQYLKSFSKSSTS